MTGRSINTVVRRLTAAEGYLELELPALALEELQRVQDPGPLSVPVMWMTAEALKALGRYEEAITPLRHVARSVPQPLRRQAWESLSECLKCAGRLDAANDAIKTSSEFPADNPLAAPERKLQLSLPKIGKLEVSIAFDGGLTISVRKAH